MHVCEREIVPSSGREAAGTQARLGLVVPGAVGTAVERNRLKRQIRAAWRELRPRIAPADCVVVVRKRAVGIAFAELARNLESSLRSLNVLVAPAPPRAGATSGAV